MGQWGDTGGALRILPCKCAARMAARGRRLLACLLVSYRPLALLVSDTQLAHGFNKRLAIVLPVEADLK